MKYIVDSLPGLKDVGEALRAETSVLDRHRRARIVFSYAREDWPFVEAVARALRIFFPQPDAFAVDVDETRRVLPNVFCYTAAGEPMEWARRDQAHSQAVQAQINEAHAAACYNGILSQSNVFVLFAYKGMIKAGRPQVAGAGSWQSLEVSSWLRTNAAGQGERVQFCADLGPAHENLAGRKAPGWESIYAVSSGAEFVPLSVTAYDESSAIRCAEQILRWLLFRQDPQCAPEACPLFSYEKMIVELYRETPLIVRAWLDAPDDEVRAARMRTLLALVMKGVPPFWPAVSRQPDFTATRVNELVRPDDDGDGLDGGPARTGEIGTARVGLDFLWPEDAPGRAPVRRKAHMVVAAALSKYHGNDECRSCPLDNRHAFPEAGPRTTIYHTLPEKVAILVAGGIAPGINAVIDGIVRRHQSYSATTVVKGVQHGFFGLANWNTEFVQDLTVRDVSSDVTHGGSCLATSRLKSLFPAGEKREDIFSEMVNTLVQERVKVLYLIGGDGTMRAAHELARRCRQASAKVSVVAIPKTMDNDILWVWQSFGFATAVEKARETIEHLATEVASNPRICVLQLFGSASGFVVSHAVLASRSNTCDCALIPEARFSIDGLSWRLAEKAARERRIIPYGMVVMAESAIPLDWRDYASQVGLGAEEVSAVQAFMDFRDSNSGRFPDGQINDQLRSAGLKLVSKGLRIRMKQILTDGALKDRLRERVRLQLGAAGLPQFYVDDERFRVFTNEPRHILRSVPPSFADVIMGNRLGALAVDNAMAGYTDFMISQWLTEFVMIPLDLVALGRKHIPEEGIFWKSVLAKTGQGDLTRGGATGSLGL